METTEEDTAIVAADAVPLSPAAFRDERFEAVAELGHGGMGVVYRCHDNEMGREVAMKILPDPGATADARTRFLREARLQGKLQHPAIAPVYELHRADDGRDFFTMREVKGVTLASVLAARDAGVDVAFGLHALLAAFSRVCTAIDYCHERGVLHRDIKPENVMLGDYGEIYVLDWGLALERHEPQLPAGTRAYAAPEQFVGGSDERSDVYSLGKVLLEILEDPAGPPELVSLGESATAFDPDDRPPCARALATAVDAYLAGERDLALRRRLADDAAAVARAAVHTPTPAARRSALRDASRALAIDPGHTDASAVIHRLLTTPPDEIPVEVERAALELRNASIRSAAIAAARGFAAILAFSPIELALGVKSWSWYVVRVVANIFTAICCAGVGKWWSASRRVLIAAFLGAGTVAVTSSMVLGPFITIPTTACAVATGLALLVERRQLAFAVAIATSLFLIPLALELAGVVPSSFEFRNGDLILHARMLDLSSQPLAIVYLLLKEIVIVFVIVGMLARFREVLSKAERSVHLHAWQLEQLLPQLPRGVPRDAARDPSDHARAKRDERTDCP